MAVLFYFLCFILFIFALPLLVVIALAILFFSGTPVIFCQKRIGLHGRIFVLYKFRTMKKGSDKEQWKNRKFNEANGPVFKIRNDPRFTPFGKFLSHTGLDELPQLLNILKGDMALIGPRPLPVDEAKKLKAWQKKREEIKPGIISPWIIEGYHSRSFDDWMMSDIAYAKKKSLGYDLVLTYRTALLMLRLLWSEVTS